jgi:hypothetical protein
MPTEVQNGRATLYGIRSNGTAITIEGYASFLIDSSKIGHKFKVQETEDELGFDASLAASNAHFEHDVTIIPTGADRDAAEEGAVFLAPLAKVTLANFALDFLNDDWIYIEGGSIDLSHSTGKLQIKLRKYADEDQNASLTQTITV